MLCETPSLSRWALLGSAGALFAWAYMPKFAFAAGNRDARFIVIVLRGALDGLSAVAPFGDPDYENLHGSLALTLDGTAPGLPLDGFFLLHPAMPNFARLYKDGQALVSITGRAARNSAVFSRSLNAGIFRLRVT